METSMFALPPVFSFVSSCPFPLLVHAHPCWVFWLVILYAYLGFFFIRTSITQDFWLQHSRSAAGQNPDVWCVVLGLSERTVPSKLFNA